MAYSTVSQLGLITATIGVGTEFAMAAAVLHTIAHACFKSGLFMLMGVIDHQAGTRMIDRLPALRKTMPWTFWATVIGLASMAGVPPLLGFISKEQIFTSFLDIESTGLAWTALAIAAFGAVLTFAYCGKILTGAFLDGEEPEENITEASWKVVVPAAFPIVIGLPLAFVVSWLEAPVLHAVTSVFPHMPREYRSMRSITAELITALRLRDGTALVLRRERCGPVSSADLRDGAWTLAAIREFVDRGMWLADLTRMDIRPSTCPIVLSSRLINGSLALWATGNVLPPARPQPPDRRPGSSSPRPASSLTCLPARGAVLLGGRHRDDHACSCWYRRRRAMA